MVGIAIDSLTEFEKPTGDLDARRDESLARYFQLEFAAMAALVRLDHSDRYRRAIQSAPRQPCLDLFVGQQIYVWRRGATHKRRLKGRSSRELNRWHGPAIVIGEERSGTNGQPGSRRGWWISHNGNLLLVAPEHVRMATRYEMMFPGLVAHLMRDAVE